MPRILLCNDTANFTETDVQATTVGDLRTELTLPNEAINVNRVVANDSHELRDDDRVAAVKTNKKGGDTKK
ncbi:hypothetical protein CMI47_10830 [Candidatus Pacearchaeota archaeon]|jgi:hypothetical protein|nr:hypothetical protein [Candidatus Pacearchaeota archaeon]|tara:strand:- start:160 stop:372 length:213 start_codon:yes stop_codon:yes gene_type:complete